MKTISECAHNGFIIVAQVDKVGNLSGKYLVFSTSGAWTQGLFNSPAEAIAAIEEAEEALWEVLSQHAFEGFLIVVKRDHHDKLKNEFFVFSKAGVYEAGPFTLEEMHKWIDEKKKQKVIEQALKAREAAKNHLAGSIPKPLGT